MNNQTNNERQRKERKLIKRQIDNIRFAQIFLGQRLTVNQLITIRELEAKLNQQGALDMINNPNLTKIASGSNPTKKDGDNSQFVIWGFDNPAVEMYFVCAVDSQGTRHELDCQDWREAYTKAVEIISQ